MKLLGALPSVIVRRRRVVFGVWVAAAVALIPLARGAEKRLETGTRVPGSESAHVAELMTSRFFSPFARYAVLVVRGLPDASTADGRAALAEVVRGVRAVAVVSGTFSALDDSDELFTGVAGGTFIVVGLRQTSARPDAELPVLRSATERLSASLHARFPGSELLWTGELPLTVDLRRVSADDANRAERRVLPLTLALLVVAFGAVGAACLPVASGALAIAMTMGAVSLVAHVTPVSILVLNVVTMLGLGLGIDYALLLVSRFREARVRGLGCEAAAVEAASHAGHSILLSGAAVLVGFLALLFVPVTDLRSIAIGGALVTAVSALLATTLLPALLASAGHRIEIGRIRRSATTAAGWTRWSRAVVGRPLLVILIAGVPVALLAWQWRRLEARTPSSDWLPASIESARGLHALQSMHRSGIVQSVRVIVEMPHGVSAYSETGWDAVARLTSTLQANGAVARVRSLPALLGATYSPWALSNLPPALGAAFVSADKRFALIEVMPAEAQGVIGAMAIVRGLRGTSPAELTGVAGTRVLVGGLPAFNVDYGDTITRSTPLVVGLVLAGTFVALLVGFRSVLIPLKAIALNLLSVAAAFGAVVLVFQDGHGSRLLGLAAPLDAIFPAIPLLVFCIVFGLSMDYEVFLVSRVAEARRRGESESEAIVEGVARTGGVITSAALVMTVVFGAFMMGEFVLMKILGFALAIAVLLDVTILRLALGPALLRLAGRWNWWPGDARAHTSADFAGNEKLPPYRGDLNAIP